MTLLRAIIEKVRKFFAEKNKRVRNENVIYMANAIPTDAMPEPVIDMDLDNDESLTGTARENENEICLTIIMK